MPSPDDPIGDSPTDSPNRPSRSGRKAPGLHFRVAFSVEIADPESIMTPEQRSKAEAFLELHRQPRLLVLVNVWDIAGARVFERAGFTALATTSSGIAASRGYPDGEVIPFAEMLSTIGHIVAGTRLPVTADIETGYGATIPQVTEHVAAVIEVGAVGINIEDASTETKSLFDVAFQVEKIRAIRGRASSIGLHLVINARTDTYLLPDEDAAGRFAETVARGKYYAAAGADCIFIPGVQDGELIARLVAEIGAPINVLAGPATPSIHELEAIGVSRLSIGGGAMRAALALFRDIAAELRDQGTYRTLFRETLTWAEMDDLLR
jgi:2-methylisocitrate lyase-like PEP mutase family enzyme